MLQELNVEGYAVVAKLRVRFQPGLNLLTGETGSGKSIVVDALSLLLGARAATDVIRPGCRRARVAGVFEVTETPALRTLLSESGVELEQRRADCRARGARQRQVAGLRQRSVADAGFLAIAGAVAG